MQTNSGLEVLLTLLVVLLIYTALFFIGYFIQEKFLIYYKNQKIKRWNRKIEKDYKEYLQRKRRRELRRAEMKKYPLFFWKESSGNS